MKNTLVIPYFIPHRGCPHGCLFCNQEKISGASIYLDSPKQVAATIEQWLSYKGDREEVQVAFFGGSFTCMSVDAQQALLQAVRPYIVSGKVQSIRCSTRPDCVDEQICDLLKEYGVSTVELGVQSLDEKVLQLSKRGHSATDCEKAFQRLKDAGFEVGIQLMPGLAGDTTYSFLQTVKKVITLGPDFVRLYPCVVVNDSGLEKLYRAGGFTPLSLSKAVAICEYCFPKFEKSGIEVVRMGLQASESLEKNIVAGPYHPAFGELVQSRLWLKKIIKKLRQLSPGEMLAMHLSHRDISTVVGQNRTNISRVEELGFKERFTLVVDKEMPRGCVEYVVSK